MNQSEAANKEILQLILLFPDEFLSRRVDKQLREAWEKRLTFSLLFPWLFLSIAWPTALTPESCGSAIYLMIRPN